MRDYTPLLLAALLGFASAGCDFRAAEDAFDNFEVVIELEPVNTVLSLNVLDASTGENIPDAVIQFGGDDVGSLIDVYSDPLQVSELETGLLTFGVANGRMPSAEAPVKFDVTVGANGYFVKRKAVSVFEEGTHSINVYLSYLDYSTPIRGTATANGTAQTDASGATTQPLVVSATPADKPGYTAGSLEIASGTVLLGADGAPLQGPIMTELRVFDGARGLQSLPTGAQIDDAGNGRVILSATMLRITDATGRVAVGIQPAASKTTDLCSLDYTPPTITGSDSPDESTTVVLLSGTSLALDVFYGIQGRGTVTKGDAAPAGPASDCLDIGSGTAITVGYLILTEADGTSESGTFDAELTIDNPNGFGVAVDLNVAATGFNESVSVTVGSGSTTKTVANWIGSSDAYTVSDQADATITGTLDDGQESSATLTSLLTGAGTLTLPTTSGIGEYTVTASAACPAGEEFDVQVTDTSLDGLVVSYKKSSQLVGSVWTVTSWTTVSDATVGITDSEITVSTVLSLEAEAEYQFRGTFDGNSETRTATPVGGASEVLIEIDPEAYGFNCSVK